MPRDIKSKDLRIRRTYKLLLNSMITMLKRKNFNHITVNDLCEEALISRATFYVHFNDKYDLLKYCLSDLNKDLIEVAQEYKKIEMGINQFIIKNKKMIANVITDANMETLGLIHNFIFSDVVFFIKKNGCHIKEANYTVLANFCAGGIVNLIILLVKEEFPSDYKVMNSFTYNMIKYIITCEDNRNI